MENKEIGVRPYLVEDKESVRFLASTAFSKARLSPSQCHYRLVSGKLAELPFQQRSK